MVDNAPRLGHTKLKPPLFDERNLEKFTTWFTKYRTYAMVKLFIQVVNDKPYHHLPCVEVNLDANGAVIDHDTPLTIIKLYHPR